MAEVYLAIYDLSMGMARNLSSQFLGPAHTIDIIPHTAIIVFGKEYFFGRGIESCTPNEFRQTRGIHPIEVKLIGRTEKSKIEFEQWCIIQGQNGQFGVESYDLLTRNCNNFSHEAAIHGLELPIGVPQWILDVPSKFLSSPMGMMIRPILEGMQLSNNAPTNMPHNGAPRPLHTHHNNSLAAATAANPWTNISKQSETKTLSRTPTLDKQTGPLLSTETGVVPACIAKIVTKHDDLPHSSDVKEEEQQTAELLGKLANAQAKWTLEELKSVHQHLRSFIENGVHLSFALMLLRLAVLKHPRCETPNTEQCDSTRLVAELLLEEKLSLANQSLAFCVLSNAVGSNNNIPSWLKSDGKETDFFLQLIDVGLRKIDYTIDGSTTTAHVSLRQSAAAFLYNVTRRLAEGEGDGINELSEASVSILIGTLENIRDEQDATTLKRRYLCVGQLLRSKDFGQTAVSLVRDLGIVDGEFYHSNINDDTESLAKEVTSLLNA